MKSKEPLFKLELGLCLTDAAVEERGKVGGAVIVEVGGETFRVWDPG